MAYFRYFHHSEKSKIDQSRFSGIIRQFLKLELFIARRLFSSDQPRNSGTRPIILIATAAIALGMTVMILALSIVNGFQDEIRSKVIGFGSHIQITNFDANNSVEANPVSIDQPFYPHLDTVSGIRHIQVFGTKAGIIKTEEEIQGVVLKGVDAQFDWSFFSQTMIDGQPIQFKDSVKSKEIVISNAIAKKLKLKVGDAVIMYFIQQPPRKRKFTVAGIYETSIEALDNTYIIGDIRHIQRLNNWAPDMVSGFEVLLDRYEDLPKLDDYIYKYIGFDLTSTKITEVNPEIFGWLELQDINVYIIIALMIIVAGINMCSALLILILERTNMIGILKALGTQDGSVQLIFIINGAFIILRGLLIGNLVGITLCLLQSEFGLVKLPKETYYIAEVPISFDLINLCLLNLFTLVVCILVLFLPSLLVNRITPVKAIRFN